MLSPEFAHTFDRAAAIIEAGHREPEIGRIIADLRTRADSATPNPLKNRALIVDSRIDSQMLGVPEAVYGVVIKELRQFHLLNVWAKATCPNTGDVIVETRNTQKFRRLLNEPCPSCGQDHSELSHDNIELFFVINFETSSEPLSLRELIAKPPPTVSHESRWQWIQRKLTVSFLERGSSPVENATAELAENCPAKLAPTPDSVLWKSWQIAASWWTATLAVVIPLWLSDNYVTIGWATFAISLCVYSVQSYITWRRINNRYPNQRRIMRATQFLGGLSLSKGAFGLRFKRERSKDEQWYELVDIGDTDETFVWAGVAIVAVGFICTAIMQFANRGSSSNSESRH